MNMQDTFLNQVRTQKTSVTIYLTNGYQIRGLVVGFDPFTVLLDCEGKQILVYKHAISTISPLKPISVKPPREAPPDIE